MVLSEAFVLLRRFLLLFIPINKITAEQKLRFLSKTGVRNGKYRNPEDSGRNMQPSRQLSAVYVVSYRRSTSSVIVDVVHAFVSVPALRQERISLRCDGRDWRATHSHSGRVTCVLGCSPPKIIFSNGPKIIFSEWSNLQYLVWIWYPESLVQ